MSRLTLAFLVVMFAGAAAPQQVAPAPSTGEENAEAKGQIAGVVISAKTGEPLRSALVVLQGGGRNGARGGPRNSRVHTGIGGRFSFEGLPPDEYVLSGSKAGYGIRQFQDLDARIQLGEDEKRNDLVLRLLPSAVITGRVLDADGEPVPDTSVSALVRGYYAGETRWTVTQSGETNDLGEYRIYGLGPGRYVVAADAPSVPGPQGVAAHELAPSFYPSGDSPEQASVLALSWGSEVAGIDFRLEPAPETAIRGVVMDDSTGGPCERCTVILQQDTGPRSYPLRTSRDGLFLMQGIAQGPGWLMAGNRGAVGRASERVFVPASGVVDVHLVVGKSHTVSAEVVLEDRPEQQADAAQDEAEPVQRPQGIYIGLQARNMNIWGPPPRATAPANGGPVELRNVAAGDYRVTAGSSDGGYLRALSIDGRELERPEIRVEPDVPLLGLKLHIAFDGATITGTVKHRDDDPTAAPAWILLMPEPGSSAYAERGWAREDDGQFRKAGIVPGSYALYALPRMPGFDLDDPEVRRTLEPYVKRVTVAKGETANVELTRVPDTF